MTQDYYRDNAERFFETTVAQDVSHLYEPFLTRLPPGGRILDAGCGSGRDARQFKDRGFEVVAFDASPELAALASKHLGQDVLRLDFSEVAFDGEFDGVWACASLLHVPKPKLPETIARLARCLKPQGALYVSFKYGDFEGVRDGRHFTDLDERGLGRAVKGLPLRIVDSWTTHDTRPGRGAFHWLSAVLTPRPLRA